MKRSSMIAALGCAVLMTAVPAAADATVKLTQNKPSGIYAKGEK